jgi:hypothetical protein
MSRRTRHRMRCREDDEALALYLDQVTDAVAYQLGKADRDDNGNLPAFFVIPAPTCADHLQRARELLSDFVEFRFDGASLPELRFATKGTA